eukprot:1011690-Prorocentrum_minimum.AAC.1
MLMFGGSALNRSSAFRQWGVKTDSENRLRRLTRTKPDFRRFFVVSFTKPAFVFRAAGGHARRAGGGGVLALLAGADPKTELSGGRVA